MLVRAGLAHLGCRPSWRCLSSVPRVGELRAVRQGVGITVLTCLIGDQHPDLVRIAPDKLFSSTDVWLLAHPDLRQTEPVATVFDFIAERGKQDRDHLLGRTS